MTAKQHAEVLRALEDSGAILKGHFQLASGRHSDTYLEKFRLLERPEHTERLCRLIAERFREEGVGVVAGPVTGGVILAYEVARQLGLRGTRGEPCRAIFAEKEGDRLAFQRGFRFDPGERTLVVDDVLTTGGSVRQTLDAVRAAGGAPIGVGVLVDRSGGRTGFGLPLYACLTLDVVSYEPADCSLCARREPLTVT